MSWTLEKIQEMINTGREEALNLDYKASEALSNKKELAKDVSAFANSDGGTIVYGVIEENHKPISIDEGINPTKLTKETIENVINDNIKPRIGGILISPIDLQSEKQLFVIDIPKSDAAPHMAQNRYYKRYNFQSVPMEHYEVLDVMNRQTGPNLLLDFRFSFPSPKSRHFNITPVIKNISKNVTSCAVIDIFIDKRLIDSSEPGKSQLMACFNGSQYENCDINISENKSIPASGGTINFINGMPIFGSKNIKFLNSLNNCFLLNIPPNSEEVEYFIKWQIESPGMILKNGLESFIFKIEDDGVEMLRKTRS
jgi:hypothetical protein